MSPTPRQLTLICLALLMAAPLPARAFERDVAGVVLAARKKTSTKSKKKPLAKKKKPPKKAKPTPPPEQEEAPADEPAAESEATKPPSPPSPPSEDQPKQEEPAVAEEEKPAPVEEIKESVVAKPKPAQPGAVVLGREGELKVRVTRHRFAFIGGGALLLGGLALGYSAQGEAKRAENLGDANQAARALAGAQTTAATANVMYGLAGVAVAYGLVLEFLPQNIAEKANLTFHF